MDRAKQVAEDLLRAWPFAPLVQYLRPAPGGHSDIVTGGAFSPDGSLLATFSADRTCRLWARGSASEPWREAQVLEGHSGWVFGDAFSPDGSVLATCSQDGTSILWRVDEGRAYKAVHIRPAMHWEVRGPHANPTPTPHDF